MVAEEAVEAEVVVWDVAMALILEESVNLTDTVAVTDRKHFFSTYKPLKYICAYFVENVCFFMQFMCYYIG